MQTLFSEWYGKTTNVNGLLSLRGFLFLFSLLQNYCTATDQHFIVKSILIHSLKEKTTCSIVQNQKAAMV